MRLTVLGLTFLAALFAAAWVWHEGTFSNLREDLRVRESDTPLPAEAPGGEPGWGLVRLGGAADDDSPPGPTPGERPVWTPPVPTGPPDDPPPPRPGPVEDEPEVPPRPEDLERRVAVGADQSLWSIVAREYGLATPARVAALAAYNDVDEPDLILPGQVLVLPAESVLDALADD